LETLNKKFTQKTAPKMAQDLKNNGPNPWGWCLTVTIVKGILNAMMYEKPFRPSLPRTVDEVADLLIADLPPQEMVTLSSMTEIDFMRLYDSVAQYVLDEFKIWTGNGDLLESCMASVSCGGEDTDPAMIILRRVWRKLHDLPEILIIT